MGGITVAHQQETNDSFAAYASTRRKSHAEAPVVTEDEIAKLLSNGSSTTTTPGHNMEDLTGEVQDLMMRESMASWLQPWTTTTTTHADDDNNVANEAHAALSGFDAHQLSLHLENLFSQGDLTEMPSPFYDEMMFVADDTSINMSAQPSIESTPVGSPQVEIVEEEEEEEITVQDDEDEPVVVPAMVEMPVATIQEEPSMPINNLKRRRSSMLSSEEEDSTDDSSDDDSSDSEDENTVIPTTVANLGSRYWSSSDESESESESFPTASTAASTPHKRRSRPASPTASCSAYAYMHKRQIEETLLNKISNQLQPEKLPGILAIISNDNAGQANGEVEIDLSCLARDQLVRLLSYVEACILEQSGGPAVDLEQYLDKKEEQQPSTINKPSVAMLDDSEDEDEMPKKKRQPRRRNPSSNGGRRRQQGVKARSRKSRQELTEDILADDESADDHDEDDVLHSMGGTSMTMSQGPISMAQLSKRQAQIEKQQGKQRRRSAGSNNGRRGGGGGGGRSKRSKKNGDDDAAAVVSTSALAHAQQVTDSIAVTRPKRRTALHKRRIMEDQFYGSEETDDDQPEGTLIVYSDEKMDFNVKDNQTIVHEASPVSTPVPTSPSSIAQVSLSSPSAIEEEEEDEEIDIML
ncbi:hypothetical protein O0I10_003521 [Lichtheimia ornata]|uniref:NET domain-containing protein n=1 Tax=Lichtheimia ornata TaxID=688661 RepID=A0AAD7Y2J0_9FUNG|nr:uncharacterized protein O0I10_003521 [Lichtheimia ornata]KAJ8660877.1 hypothetical protein O0I10_003521 [Lichtheimia ornata]